MPHVKANNLSMYVEEKGVGKPVLFISGTGADLRVKPNVLDGPLPEVARVIAYDQRGLGQTEKPETDYTMADYADDAAALISELKLSKLDVIGVSFGGMVALQLVLRHPELVGKLVLCCTSSGGQHASFPFHELPENLTVEERLLRLMPINDTRRDETWQQEHPDAVEAMVAYTIEHAIPDHALPDFKAGARRQLLARAGHNVEDKLAVIKAKTLICAGKYDGIAPPENQTALLEGISNAELKWYEGGHLFMVQDKRALRDVIEFLS